MEENLNFKVSDFQKFSGKLSNGIQFSIVRLKKDQYEFEYIEDDKVHKEIHDGSINELLEKMQKMWPEAVKSVQD